MPAPATADEFLDLVRKSGVADDSRIQPFLKKLAQSGESTREPSQLAGFLVRDGLLTHFQADQLLQGKWKRFSIGKYKVLERIGAGGMGQVFLCEHKMMRRRVAVKVLPAAKAADPASLERFYREARAVAALDHPNIVRAYDIDQDDNLHFIVMEYVDGTNLQDLVKKAGTLDVVRAAHYVYWSAVGLQHAHEMGLVHRDIKPGNILVDRQGVVKILDMGLARFFHDTEDGITKKYDESILGTADYLAPEQALDSHTVDIRADIYALGGTFYFMLTGQAPFPEGTVAQKLLWHQTREPAPIRSLRPDCPAELVELVGRMMAKDPFRRFQTPADLMAALAGWAQAPVAPPSERELPQLSLAALGGASPRSSSSGSGNYKPASPGASSSQVPRYVPAPAPQSFVPQPSYTPPAPIPAMSFAPPAYNPPPAPTEPAMADAAETEPANFPAPGGSWDAASASDSPFVPPSTSRETPRRDRSAAATKPAAAAPARTRRAPAQLAALGGGGVALAGVGAFLAYLVFGGSSAAAPEVSQTEGSARRLYVTKAAAAPGATDKFKTLAAAVKAAQPGDTVVLQSDLNEPPVRINGKTHAGIQIEADGPGKQVAWSVVTSGSPVAMLLLEDPDGVRVSGLMLDCADRTVAGVIVAGRCPGLVIDNVTVRSPKEVGFRFRNAVGEPNGPATLTNYAVFARSGGDKLDAGVALTGRTTAVRIEGGRIVGPALCGLKVDGTSDSSGRGEGAAADVSFRNNRVFDAEAGVRVTDKVSGEPFGLAVEGNTFYKGKTGVACATPLAGPKRTLTLSKNYFAKFGDVLSVTGDASGLKAADNARDKSTKDGKLNPKAATVAEELPAASLNPDEPAFLRTSAVPGLAAFGAK